MRFLPRFPLYSAVAVAAAASTILLTATPASAQQDFWDDWLSDNHMADEDDRHDCAPPTDPQDPLNERPWNLDAVGGRIAHRYNEGLKEDGTAVKVAVIDSGVTASHPTFGGRVLEGADVYDADAYGQCDMDGHGTAVAGIIAGGSDEQESGYMGIAPQAEIVPIRLFQNRGESGDTVKSQWIADAITAAVDAGVDVINVSIAVLHTEPLQQATEAALNDGVIIVAATGNAGLYMDDPEIEPNDQAFYPANYPGVIAVGAHNEYGNYYTDTNFGENMDLLAPGQNLGVAAANGEDYLSETGTSFAAPHVAGAAALLVGHFGEDQATPAWVEQRLRDTAIHPPDGFNFYQGYGVLNIPNALTAPLNEDSDEEQTFIPAEPSQIPIIDVGYDPLATEKMIAWASVGGSLVLIVLVLVLRRIIPQGRRRGWRPGIRSNDRLPVKTADEGL